MIRIEVDKQAGAQVIAKVEALAGAKSREQFFTRLGAQVLRWIDQNIRTSGSLAGGWRPLSELTLFGRRSGHNIPLETLRQTFTSQATENEVRVGTSREVAKYHEFGTGTFAGGDKYPILPRFKKALAFPAPPGFLGSKQFGGASFLRPVSYGEAKRGVTTLGALRKAGVATGPGLGSTQVKPFAVVRGVMHPGVPKRRMLPNVEEAQQILRAVEKAWFTERTVTDVKKTTQKAAKKALVGEEEEDFSEE